MNVAHSGVFCLAAWLPYAVHNLYLIIIIQHDYEKKYLFPSARSGISPDRLR